MGEKPLWDGQVEKVDTYRHRIPRTYRSTMKTSGLLFANEKMLASVRRDSSLNQVVNVAELPGIVGPSMAMPDIHQGYGFPIGGVAAFDAQQCVVSPGGVGYDINCGVRLVLTPLKSSLIRE